MSTETTTRDTYKGTPVIQQPADSEAAPGDKRTAILAAALDLFASRTFAGCPVPLVAERAGVATGTIYRYFPGKEALVNAVYRLWKGELKRLLVDELPEGLDTRGEFHWWWDRLSQFALANPTAFEFLELHHHEAYLDDASRRLSLEIDAEAVAFAARGQASGEIRSGSPAVLVALVFGAFAGLMRARRAFEPLFTESSMREAEEAVWDLVSAKNARSGKESSSE